MKGIPADRAARQRVSRCGLTLTVFRHAGFFCFSRAADAAEDEAMDKPDPTVAQEIARVASVFEEKLTGRAPQSVAVVLSGDTLVITMHGALSPAEQVLARTPEGAAELQEYHRRLFASSFDDLRQEIKRITGVE